MIFIKTADQNGLHVIDSAEIVHGNFNMTGTLDSVSFASLYMDDENIMPIIMEKGHIHVSIDNTQVTAGGTTLNDKLYDFIVRKNNIDDRAYEVSRMESRMIMDGIAPEEVDDSIGFQLQKLSDELNQLARKCIEDNYENVLGPGLFIMLCSNFPYPVATPEIEEIVKNAPQSFRSHPFISEYMKAAAKHRKDD